MANEFSGLFDSTNGVERTYIASELATVFRAFGGTGVSSLDDDLKVSPQGNTMTTLVSPGLAMIKGYVYELQDDGGAVYACEHEPSAGSDRIDRVVLKLDLDPDVCAISMGVRTGTPGSSPSAPTLMRSETVYEISLAQIKISAGASSILETDIIDERPDESLCGALLPEALKLSTLYDRLGIPTATTTEEGLLSASDKQKLDELSTQASQIIRSDGTSVETYENTLLTQLTTAQTTADSKASTTTYSATFASSGWSSSAPYTQTVSITGILSTDNPIVDITSLSTTTATAVAQLESFGYIGQISTASGSITATCYEDKPTTSFTVQLKVIR